MENTIQSRLEEIARVFNEETAVVYGNREMSYGRLHKESSRIANGLISRGIQKGSCIGILMEDKLDLVSTLLGILKAACVFVPMDPEYPDVRISEMIHAADVKHVFYDKRMKVRLESLLKEKEAKIITPDEMEPRDDCAVNAQAQYHPEDPIYIYFTSGSTGRPKAILGKNKSLLHFINWEAETFQVNEHSHVSQFTPPCHDPFLRDVFLPLCVGGKLCIPPDKDTLLKPRSIAQWIENEDVTLIHCTPSLFRVINSANLTGESFKNLQWVFLAGEKVNPAELKKWYGVFDERIQLVNLYGPTETTLAKLYHPILKSETDFKRIPIGKPIKGARAILLDGEMNVCGQGIAGEIYIRTPYRSLGYYKNPEMNSVCFIQNPFSSDPQDKIYKTGDMGRLLPDGNIEFLGRADRQIKIRGFRIEPGEIENMLLNHEDILEAAVVVRERSNGDTILCAYLVLKADKSDKAEKELTEELRTYLSDRLPYYMVPQAYTFLPRMPLTPNRKLDYKALPEPGAGTGNEYIPPKDETEKRLTVICAEILGIEKIGMKDKFLQLGGNSLHIMMMISRIHKEFGVELKFRDVFYDSALETIAGNIKKLDKSSCISIKPAAELEAYLLRNYPQNCYPLSSAQTRMYFLSRLDPNSTSYNISGAIVIEGGLDISRMEDALRKLIRRHEALRTSFENINGELLQRIHSYTDFSLESIVPSASIDSGSDEKMDIESLKPWVKEFIRPFDLSKAPLFRAGIIKITEDKHIFIYDTHHIISDGTSMGILVREFSEIYNRRELPELHIQYKDYAFWQNESYAREDVNLKDDMEGTGGWELSLKEQEKYWLERFRGEIPKIKLPYDFKRPEIQSFKGDRLFSLLPEDVTSGLSKLAEETESTLYMVLLAVYNILLSKYTRQRDVVVGTPIAGRPHDDLTHVIGMFVNVLAMRNNVEGSLGFTAFLETVKENTLKAFENQHYQFELLVQKLDISGEKERNPLFDTVFALHNIELGKIEMGDLRFLPFEFEYNTAKFDLMVLAMMQEGRLGLTFEYGSGLFRRETVERMAKHFKSIAVQIIENPQMSISKITLLTEEEKKNLLQNNSGTVTGCDGTVGKRPGIHDLESEFNF